MKLLCGLLELGDEPLVEQHGKGIGQLVVADAGDDLLGVLVPLGDDEQTLEERLVVAALGRLVGTGVDERGVFGQLQGELESPRFDVQPQLGLSQGLFGLVNLVCHALALVAESVGRGVVALFGVETQQSGLLGLELVDQLVLGCPDLLDGLAADADECFDRARPVGDLLGRELDGSLAVAALDRLLDQLGTDVGAHGASRTVDPGATEEVGVLHAVAAGTDAVAEALAAGAAEDAALEVVAVDLRPLASGALLIEQGLHPVERVLVDQGVVKPLECLLIRGAALVDDPAGIVGIAQYALNG